MIYIAFTLGIVIGVVVSTLINHRKKSWGILQIDRHNGLISICLDSKDVGLPYKTNVVLHIQEAILLDESRE